MAFGNVVRQADSPTLWLYGAGGDANTIWHCDWNTAYELSTVDFAVVKQAGTPSTAARGIGGTANTIWHCDDILHNIYELSVVDFSIIRQRSAPAYTPSGIGGDANTIWHCDRGTDYVYELSTTDLAQIRYTSSPSTQPSGIGGDANTIWHCDDYIDDIYELLTSDFSVAKNVNSPSTMPYGIGGTASVIWHCDYLSKQIYELDTVRAVPKLWSKLESAADVTSPQIGTGGAELGSPTYLPAKFGNGILSDIANEGCTFPTAANSINLNKGAIEFWQKINYDPTEPNYHFVFDFYLAGHGGIHLRFYHYEDTFQVQVRSGGTYPTFATATGLSWSSGDVLHFGIAWDREGIDIGQGKTLIIKVDNVELGSSVETWDADTVNSNLYIGVRESGASPSLAVIDNLKTYDECKTDFSDKDVEGAVIHQLTATSSAVSSTSGSLTVGKVEALTATSSAISSITGSLTLGKVESLTATSSAISSITGSLTVGKIESLSGIVSVSSSIEAVILQVTFLKFLQAQLDVELAQTNLKAEETESLILAGDSETDLEAVEAKTLISVGE